MKSGFPLFLLALCGLSCRGDAAVVYSNSFNSSADLNGFTIYSQTYPTYNPPPLDSESVTGGQLRINTSYNQPNSPSDVPTLQGRGNLMLDTSSFGYGYSTTFANATQTITWTFNLSNQDGAFNNEFGFIMGTSVADFESTVGAVGYGFFGGGFVGNRMMLGRFGPGGLVPLIDISSGLGTLPQTGSFKITYEPLLDRWSLYGSMGSSYVDPTTVSTVLGTVVDSTYTHTATPYLGMLGEDTGSDFFDNVAVATPEPSAGLLVLPGMAFLFRRNRR